MNDQLVVFEVRTTPEVQLSGSWVKLDAMGMQRTVEMTDDGSTPGDVPYDGMWEGTLRSAFAADVQATLIVKTTDGESHTLYQGVILLDNADRSLVSWRLALEGKDLTAWRTATDWPTGKPLIGDANWVFVGIGWLIVLIVYVGMLFESAPSRAGRAP